MKNYKIRVNNEAESKEAQKLFVQLGYKLDSFFGKYEATTKWVLACADGSMGCASEGMAKDTLKEITFPQLRDLVVLKRGDIADATHYQTIEPDSKFFVTSNSSVFFFDEDDAWVLSGVRLSELTPINHPQDPALISGDVALANVHKCTVQYLHDDEPYGRWTTITDNLWSQYHLGMFLDPDTKFKFRFKPQTIKLELELPKPFDPKVGEWYFFVSTENDCGYSTDKFEGLDRDVIQTQFGAYRTANEVKQVVEQLRKIKGAV